jgi:hypothetical protein
MKQGKSFGFNRKEDYHQNSNKDDQKSGGKSRRWGKGPIKSKNSVVKKHFQNNDAYCPTLNVSLKNILTANQGGTHL